MKILLTLLLLSNVAIIWFFFLRGNVRINFGKNKDEVHAEMKINTSGTGDAAPQDDEDLVQKSTVRIEDIRAAVAGMLPGMVRSEVKEYLNEKDTEFDDTLQHPDTTVTADNAAPGKRFEAEKDIDKAFEDHRLEGPAEGQTAAPADDDGDGISFDELNKGLTTLKDSTATAQEKRAAVKALLSVEGTNLVVSLPEPLHSNFRDMLTDYAAGQIDAAEDAAKKKTDIPKPKAAKSVPDNIEDFNIRDFKN